jgi:hypothetical protein
MPDHKYNISCHDIQMWKQQELAHVGRIAAMKDKDLQYSYALSTVNGMVHLRDAIYERVLDMKDKEHKMKLLQEHDAVVRVIQHLIKDYGINLNTIRAFNERHVLRNMSYLKPKGVRHVRFGKTMRKKNKKNE